MKLLLLPLLLLAGLGGYGLRSGAKDEVPAACSGADCRITVQCTGPNTCLVTCYDENGDVRCQKEVTCDGPCQKAGEATCKKSCEASSACPQR
jgi:hypothetical protein